MKDNYMTLVIKPSGLVEFPRQITINGKSYDVELVAAGHVPAAHDVAEEFIKNSAADFRERAGSEANVDDEVIYAEETLQKIHSHKEYGYAD